ncbi:hypothetical protein ACFCXG_38090, partial [Streptomyces sp. NPDC056295]|uniref:hypothetical protein n=1 Tax=Streptomyces sp. NPDC056295 TaxID=3345774 RepID=UPI0035DFEB15
MPDAADEEVVITSLATSPNVTCSLPTPAPSLLLTAVDRRGKIRAGLVAEGVKAVGFDGRTGTLWMPVRAVSASPIGRDPGAGSLLAHAPGGFVRG